MKPIVLSRLYLHVHLHNTWKMYLLSPYTNMVYLLVRSVVLFRLYYVYLPWIIFSCFILCIIWKLICDISFPSNIYLIFIVSIFLGRIQLELNIRVVFVLCWRYAWRCPSEDRGLNSWSFCCHIHQKCYQNSQKILEVVVLWW